MTPSSLVWSPINKPGSPPFPRSCLFLPFAAQRATADLNAGCFAANGHQLRRGIRLAERWNGKEQGLAGTPGPMRVIERLRRPQGSCQPGHQPPPPFSVVCITQLKETWKQHNKSHFPNIHWFQSQQSRFGFQPSPRAPIFRKIRVIGLCAGP